LFFFFQAEDGIRDLIVTGVQTCALPISSRVDAIQLGECYVHDDDVGLQLLRHLDGAAPVSGLAHDLDPVVRRQDASEALAHDRLRIDEQDPYARRLQARNRRHGPTRAAPAQPPGLGLAPLTLWKATFDHPEANSRSRSSGFPRHCRCPTPSPFGSTSHQLPNQRSPGVPAPGFLSLRTLRRATAQ